MTKAKISVAIFTLIVIYAVISQLIIKDITDELSDKLYAVRASASAGDYTTADALNDELLNFYNSQEIVLDIFVKKEAIATLSVSLNSLSAYIAPDNLSDLQSEIDKAQQHTKALEKAFSTLF